MKKLYVGNLPFQTSEQGLRDWFAQAGIQVDSITLIRDSYTNQLRGFGFVEINNDDEAVQAMQLLDGKNFNDRPLTINEARPRRESGRKRFDRGPKRKRPRW